MITREFNLYLHAGHSIPLVINVNQYDQGEQWLFTLFNADGTQYVPSSGAIVGIKSDNLGIINSGTVDSQGRVVINETQQMTAAVGKAVFELLIDDQTHGTANFIVLVEPKPGDNADLSESDYSLFQQAIDGTSATAIAEGVADWMDENLTPTTPVVDASLTVQGAAADSAKVGQELSDLKSQISTLSSIPAEVKQAMDTLFSKIAVKDDDTYLEEYGIIHEWANAVEVASLSAVFTPGNYPFITTDSLDRLKRFLVVTATYSDTTSEVVDDYELSGTLIAGESTITVAYGGKSATFTVTVLDGVDVTPNLANGTPGRASTQYTYDAENDTLRVYTSTSADYHAVKYPLTMESGYDYYGFAYADITSGKGKFYYTTASDATISGSSPATLSSSGELYKITAYNSTIAKVSFICAWTTKETGNVTYRNPRFVKVPSGE